MTGRTRLALLTTLLLSPGIAYAQDQPPHSPQDQVCRDEARSRVLSGRNPPGADLRAIGRRYWDACMARAGKSSRAKARGAAKPARATRRR